MPLEPLKLRHSLCCVFEWLWDEGLNIRDSLLSLNLGRLLELLIRLNANESLLL